MTHETKHSTYIHHFPVFFEAAYIQPMYKISLPDGRRCSKGYQTLGRCTNVQRHNSIHLLSRPEYRGLSVDNGSRGDMRGKSVGRYSSWRQGCWRETEYLLRRTRMSPSMMSGQKLFDFVRSRRSITCPAPCQDRKVCCQCEPRSFRNTCNSSLGAFRTLFLRHFCSPRFSTETNIDHIPYNKVTLSL
jgi:hypothetical protein